MPTFRYQAVGPTPEQAVRGAMQAPSLQSVVEQLKSQGLYPTQVDPVISRTGLFRRKARRDPSLRILRPASPSGFWKKTRVRKAAVAVWTRQLATLLSAGVPLLRGLEILARQERNVPLQKVIRDLAEGVKAGERLSVRMAKYDGVFDPLYTQLVKAGEAGGRLDEVLERSAGFLEKGQRLRGKVQAALAYPIIIAVVAAAIVGALTTFVVPKFEQIFASQLQGRPLPALTQVVITLSRWTSGHLLELAVGLGVGGAIALWIGRQAWGRQRIERVGLALPVVGGFILQLAVARFARTLGTLLSSGVPILQSLTLTRETTGALSVAAALSMVYQRVEAGESLAASLDATRRFPPLLPAMVEVGEATGKLPEMLHHLADIYELHVDTAMITLTSLIEPVMIVVMAIVVGTIVIALFLPMIEIIKGLSGG
ncbi:MAG TPA: type II secretion system F family protein [Opitutaceae bacterium]|nr:type II secretion system F family protein [Opitutaceae bacterium]